MGVDNLTASLLSAVFMIALYMNIGKRTKNPPGPRQLPLVGNLLNFPREKRWETFAKWKQQYGDIVYLNMLGTPIIVLNSVDVCTDLLDKRSNKYSGRRPSILLNEYMDLDYAFALMDYSPRWRTHRRLFHQHFNEHITPKYKPIQERAVHHFIKQLLLEPADFIGHIRLLFGETILDIVYDIKAEDRNNIFIRTAEKAVDISLEVTIPGRFLVEFFPAMKYLPSWFPGGTFKKFAAKNKQAIQDVKNLPFNYVKECMETGTVGSSVLSSMLNQCNNDLDKETSSGEPPEEIAKGCAALAYVAGADTTLSTIQAFFMVIANHPDVQRAAWRELDALLGTSNRLPTFGDETHLPFIVAITNELLRWHNVAPLGLPHVVTEDDVYNGYFIRKGTIVFGNIWGLMHDPVVYPEPHVFNPWRWLTDTPAGLKLNPAIPDPRATFGFGRRICPGRHLAWQSLFITIADVLACFEIKPLDTNGRPTDHLEELFTDGIISYPTPYKVLITPRSGPFTQLVRDMVV